MRVPWREPDPQEPDDVDEHFTMPARNIYPMPPSRRLILIICAVGAFVLLCSGIGTLFALHIAENNAQHSDHRRAVVEAQLANLQAQLADQQNQLRSEQTKSRQTICTFIIAVLEQSKKQGQQVTQPSLDFVRNFGCQVPAGLVATPPR